MKKLLIIFPFLSYNIYAQETINSNNTNYNTTTQDISNISNDIHNNIDSSVSTINNIDNSLGNLRNNPVNSNNTTSSNNQWNQTNQEITNNNTRTVSGTNESFNGTQTGDIINDVNSRSTSGSTSTSGSLSGSNSNSGASSTSGSSNVSINNKMPHQAPMAWAPNMAMSFSQFNCNNSAAVGASSPFGGLSVGVPITGDDCVRFWDTVMWMNLQQPAIACYRMLQHEGNKDAMQAAGLNCNALTTPAVPVVVPDYTKNHPSSTYWEKQEKLLDNKLSTIHHTNQMK